MLPTDLCSIFYAQVATVAARPPIRGHDMTGMLILP